MTTKTFFRIITGYTSGAFFIDGIFQGQSSGDSGYVLKEVDKWLADGYKEISRGQSTSVKQATLEAGVNYNSNIVETTSEKVYWYKYSNIEVVVISNEVQVILNKFDNGDYIVPSDINSGIELVRNGSVTNDEFLSAFNNLLQNGTIIDKTIAIIPPIVLPPTPIQLSADNFLANGNVRVIRITGIPSNDYELKDGVPLENLQSFLDSNAFRLLTQAELDYVAPPVVIPPVVIPPVIIPPVVIPKEYDVNTYRINEFGGVYNEIIYGIDGNRLLQLESEFLVTLVGSPTPSDQEVKDFYNYIDIDTSVKPTMVEQRFLEFKIVNGYVQGKINHIATQFFTDYWRSKTIYSIIKIDDSNGNVILLGNEPKQQQKVNELRFNQDDFEQISINEYVGDIPALTITAYVWDKINLNSNPQAFSGVKTLQVVKDDPDGKTCPTGYHLGFNGKCVLDGGEETGGPTSIIGKALGFTALLGTLALLGAKRR
tara:strand:+ start:156 stop:1607 length:1452 start_codon:yes stop_codon:yes gene_type:complete